MRRAIVFGVASLAVLTVCVLIAACGQRGGTQGTPDAAPAAGDEEGPCPTVPAADREKVVAKVGEAEITVCDVTEALHKMSPYLQKAYEAPEKRRQFVDNMIRFELIAQEAERRGYANDPEVQRVLKQMMIQRLNKELQDSVRLSDITEEQMRAFYEENQAEYHRPEMVRLSRILAKTQAEAERVLALAKQKASDSRYFRELAREHSIDDQTKEHGGDMPYFPRAEERREEDPVVDAALVEAAFQLDMRDPLYQKVVKTADGWNVIRLRGRRKARDLSFEDVKRQIRHRLHRDKLREARDGLIAKLRKGAEIDVDEAVLGQVRVDMPEEPLPPEPLPGMEDDSDEEGEGEMEAEGMEREGPPGIPLPMKRPGPGIGRPIMPGPREAPPPPQP